MEDQLYPKPNGMSRRLKHLREKCEEKIRRDLIKAHGMEVILQVTIETR